METKRIILEGITVEELIEVLTEAVKTAITPVKVPEVVKPAPEFVERPISKRKAAAQLGIDVRTLCKILRRNNFTVVTASVLDVIRQQSKQVRSS
ncbi:MAG: hypothetical protein K0M40_03830 [Prolixibacteraceae bacterium]|nr:hypothetical protein [Prolixibacteraceae bacterium]